MSTMAHNQAEKSEYQMFVYEINSMTLEQILFHLILVLLFFSTSFSRFILRFISLFGKLAV